MSRIVDFISANIRTIGIVYAVVALIVFVAVLVFFWWVGKAEDEERELHEHDYYPDSLAGDMPRMWETMLIASILAFFCAILWWAIPVLLLGVWVYTEITERFPQLMGDLRDDIDKEEEKKE